MHKNQVNELVKKSSDFAQSHGIDTVKDIETRALQIINWIQFNTQHKKTGVADELIDSSMCAIRETAACLALGLVRPALFSLRAQIDLVLTWLYFKDHPIEWNRANETGEGFKLKTEIIKYLMEMYPRYSSRFTILKQTKSRKEEDPYRLLSAHIHAQSSAVIPVVTSLSDSVASTSMTKECGKIQFEVSEYLSDVLSATFLEDHVKFPAEITKGLVGRMKTEAQRIAFFDGT